ncbi:hypothetical protein V8C42DRAFT_223847 [Trichoderma barbatum]
MLLHYNHLNLFACLWRSLLTGIPGMLLILAMNSILNSIICASWKAYLLVLKGIGVSIANAIRRPSLMISHQLHFGEFATTSRRIIFVLKV